MSGYLLPPYKAYIKTDTGKIVKYSLVERSEISNNDLYVIWQEIYYGTVATFKERVVATADTMEELKDGKDNLQNKRPHRY